MWARCRDAHEQWLPRALHPTDPSAPSASPSPLQSRSSGRDSQPAIYASNGTAPARGAPQPSLAAGSHDRRDARRGGTSLLRLGRGVRSAPGGVFLLEVSPMPGIADLGHGSLCAAGAARQHARLPPLTFHLDAPPAHYASHRHCQHPFVPCLLLVTLAFGFTLLLLTPRHPSAPSCHAVPVPAALLASDLPRGRKSSARSRG